MLRAQFDSVGSGKSLELELNPVGAYADLSIGDPPEMLPQQPGRGPHCGLGVRCIDASNKVCALRLICVGHERSFMRFVAWTVHCGDRTATAGRKPSSTYCLRTHVSSILTRPPCFRFEINRTS